MRAVAILLIACQLSACTSWRLETLSPADVMQQQYPEVVRVERADGHREVWYRPQMNGDSLVGWWDTTQKRPDRRVPLSDIRQVSTSHVSGGKTAALALGVAAVIGVFMGLST